MMVYVCPQTFPSFREGVGMPDWTFYEILRLKLIYFFVSYLILFTATAYTRR